MRRQLGLKVTAATVMVIGGGDGMGKLEAIAEALSRTLGLAGLGFRVQGSESRVQGSGSRV